MKHTPRFLVLAALILALGGTLGSLLAPRAIAQATEPAPATPAPPATPEAPPAAPAAPATPAAPAAPAAAPVVADPALVVIVKDFWHYGMIAKYDLAAAEGQKILAAKDRKAEMLASFELVQEERTRTAAAAHEPTMTLDDLLIRLQGIEQTKDVAGQISSLLSLARKEKFEDQTFIETQVKKLTGGEQSYLLAIERLRPSGELAAPVMVDYLRSAERKPYHAAILRALRQDLKRVVLPPLLEALSMKDEATLLVLIDVVGDIGYDVSKPYLLRLAKTGSTEGIKLAAMRAIGKIDGTDKPTMTDSADAFLQLAEKCYYGQAGFQADSRRQVSFLWSWDEVKGLNKRDIPNPIFNDMMALHFCEEAMAIDPNKSAAIALWLAGNYKAEIDLPAGAKNPLRPEGSPNAHFYGVNAGTQYLDMVLARALKDRNSALATKAIESLEKIAGRANSLAAGSPLFEALNYPDRTVRIPAAMAIASAQPQQKFAGSDQVVPVLAEALAQTGKSAALVLASSDELNKVLEAVKGLGITAEGGATVDSLITAASKLPGVDVIIVTKDASPAEADRVRTGLSGTRNLALVPVVYVVASKQSPLAEVAMNNPLVSITTSADAAGWKPAIDDARKKAGSAAMPEELATKNALRAAELLKGLAVTQSDLFAIQPAQPALLAALDDARPEIVKAAAGVLAWLDAKETQLALAIKATDEKTADDLKIPLLNALASNARTFGNRVEGPQLDAIQKLVSEAKAMEVRSAAAEVAGALNLPAERAKKLIMDQAAK